MKTAESAEEIDSGVREVFAELMPIEQQAINTDAQVAQVSSPWFKTFITYDPRPALRKMTCPVLALFAEKDLQVPTSQNRAEMERALKAGGNDDVTIIELPGLNHLYQVCTTGSPTEYAQIEETISPVALETIAEWIGERVGE